MLSQVVLALPCCLITGSVEEKFMNLRAAAAGMRLGTQSNAARLSMKPSAQCSLVRSGLQMPQRQALAVCDCVRVCTGKENIRV